MSSMLKNLPNIHWKKKKEKPLESLSLFKNQLGSLNFTQNQLSRPKVLEIGKWVCSKCRNGAIKRETVFSRIILFKSTKHWKEKKKIQVALTLAISSALIRTNSFLLWEPAMSRPLVSIYSLPHKKKNPPISTHSITIFPRLSLSVSHHSKTHKTRNFSSSLSVLSVLAHSLSLPVQENTTLQYYYEREEIYIGRENFRSVNFNYNKIP